MDFGLVGPVQGTAWKAASFIVPRFMSYRRCFPCDRLGHCRLQTADVVDGARRQGRGGEDCLGVAVEDIQPGSAILRIVEARRVGDAKLRAQECCAKLDELCRRDGLP